MMALGQEGIGYGMARGVADDECHEKVIGFILRMLQNF